METLEVESQMGGKVGAFKGGETKMPVNCVK